MIGLQSTEPKKQYNTILHLHRVTLSLTQQREEEKQKRNFIKRKKSSLTTFLVTRWIYSPHQWKRPIHQESVGVYWDWLRCIGVGGWVAVCSQPPWPSYRMFVEGHARVDFHGKLLIFQVSINEISPLSTDQPPVSRTALGPALSWAGRQTLKCSIRLAGTGKIIR